MKTSFQDVTDGLTYLHQIEILQDLSPAELQAMDEMTTMKKVAAGTVFYTPQQLSEVVFLVKEGRVRLYQLSDEGKQFNVAQVEAGTFFGEMTLLGQSLCGCFAEAATPCVLCIMSREDVKRALLGDVRIAARIVEALGRRLHETEKRLADFALKSVAARLATLLVQMAYSPQAHEEHKGFFAAKAIEIACTHEELAHSVGAYRETVTKILNQWREQKLLELHRGRLVLLDITGLRNLSAD